MTTKQIDLAERYGLRLDATEVHENPNMDDMPAGSTHWEVTLESVDDPAHYMTFTYSMGSACATPPNLYDVLSSLRSDACMWDNGELASFDDYCASFGYDNDSRKAERDYVRTRDAVRRQTSDLRYVLQDQYAALMEDEDVS